MAETYDLAIVGGGIVGLATCFQLSQRAPGLKVILLEKETAVGSHQSSRNSGVLHSGIYYPPGSAKATHCIEGKSMMEQFCQEHQIPWERCGKVIVATEGAQVPYLEKLHDRAVENGIACERISVKELKALEPHAAGVRAIHVPGTGIVDFGAVCRKLAERVVASGLRIERRWQLADVGGSSTEFILRPRSGESIRSRYLVNCGGLHSDRILRMTGQQPPVRIIPFRGEYYELTPEASHLCRNLIYPVPDPNFPFLGVHFTRMIGGGVECGPNAVLAMAREGYTWRNWNLRDLGETLGHTGFRKIAMRYMGTGIGEIGRSLWKPLFVRALQKLIPEIQGKHLRKAPAGVRAQAISADGKLVDDFLFVDQPSAIHVCNAPSPAATASLRIGQTIADKVIQRFLRG